MKLYAYDNDFLFTDEGDFSFNEFTKDLNDTKRDPMLGFTQRIKTVLESTKLDWKHDLNIGMGLTDFLGKPNNTELANAIENRIFSELTKSKLINAEDLRITVFPTGKNALMIVLNIFSQYQKNKVSLFFSYSLSENKIVLKA